MIESYLQTLLDNLPMTVWMKDKQGRYLAGNEKLAQELGVVVRDLEGTVDSDCFSPQMAQGFVDDDHEVLSTGMGKCVVQEVRRADGSVYWAYTHKSPVVVGDEIVGTVGFALDVSAERRLSLEKSLSEHNYQFLIDSMPVAAMVYDLDFRRIYVNKQYEKMIGFPARHFLGKKPTDHWSSNVKNLTAEQYERYLTQAVVTGEAVSFNMVYTLTADGVNVVNVKLIPQKNGDSEVISVLAVAEDVTVLHGYKAQIEHMVYHDYLTGMANRERLSEEIANMSQHAQTSGQHIALMVIDLDEFKAINDAMGHAVGDKLLKEVASRIIAAHKKQHFCARLGGDEFAILLGGFTDAFEPELLAKDLLFSITQPYEVDEEEYFISASIGIAVYPEHTNAVNDLIKCADLAMHHARALGRNCYSYYSAHLMQLAQKRLKIEVALRRAVDKNELRLEYQPIIDLASQKIVGVEALCRWHNAELGHVSPVDFIPVAEHTGLIVEIGRNLMRTAFESVCQINQLSQHIVTVSVNISAKQFYEENFITDVIALFEETQCQPAWVKFEITESLLLESKPTVLRALTALDRLGIKISLDDFGTGQSALAYLQKFPIYQIKIDRSFVKEIHTNEDSALLVKAIVSLASSLNKEVVAEGVETIEHQSLLKTFGCENGQGYLYSPSVALTHLITLMRERNA